MSGVITIHVWSVHYFQPEPFCVLSGNVPRYVYVLHGDCKEVSPLPRFPVGVAIRTRAVERYEGAFSLVVRTRERLFMRTSVIITSSC